MERYHQAKNVAPFIAADGNDIKESLYQFTAFRHQITGTVKLRSMTSHHVIFISAVGKFVRLSLPPLVKLLVDKFLLLRKYQFMTFCRP
jgi:hypothetical protein